MSFLKVLALIVILFPIALYITGKINFDGSIRDKNDPYGDDESPEDRINRFLDEN